MPLLNTSFQISLFFFPQDTPAPGTSKRAIKPKTTTPKKKPIRRAHIEIEYEVENDSPQRQRTIK